MPMWSFKKLAVGSQGVLLVWLALEFGQAAASYSGWVAVSAAASPPLLSYPADSCPPPTHILHMNLWGQWDYFTCPSGSSQTPRCWQQQHSGLWGHHLMSYHRLLDLKMPLFARESPGCCQLSLPAQGERKCHCPGRAVLGSAWLYLFKQRDTRIKLLLFLRHGEEHEKLCYNVVF